MELVLTLVTLACTLTSAVLLRFRWPRLTTRTQERLQVLTAVLLAPSVFSLVTKWDVTNHVIANLEVWIRVVACQYAIVFLTLLRPRALTIGIAAVLLPFLFATSVTGPLSYLFQFDPIRIMPIADGYVLETLPWHGVDGNSGIEYYLSYQPPRWPGLQRGITGYRFYNSQCNTAATYAVLRPATQALDVYCPPLPVSQPLSALSGRHDHHLIPRGALSPALRQATHR